MKCLTIIVLLLSFQSFSAEAFTDYALNIVRKDSKSTILCSKGCEWGSKGKYGSVSPDVLEKEVKPFIEHVLSPELPKFPDPEHINSVVTVYLKTKENSVSFSLAPESAYKGKDLEKCKKLNQMINKIELLLQRQSK